MVTFSRGLGPGPGQHSFHFRDAPYYIQQEELNARVVMLNEYVRYMNAERLLYGPHIAEFTHNCEKTGNLTHRFWLTIRDGFHLWRPYTVTILDRFVINILQLLGLW